MLAAIITLSLISLLVATEADPSGSSAETHSGEPLRPPGRPESDRKTDRSDRLAA
ncbi:hypothetical protein [Oleiharenicola lentus]|jgi:hypothetical protein|uniref:hypothetical protein n=1 Tax=Oleiharenicola lentus TaxID=2508720 RepID=UPI0013E96FE4|nr:hypothetical protein [Oleiharenicola lentus]